MKGVAAQYIAATAQDSKHGISDKAPADRKFNLSCDITFPYFRAAILAAVTNRPPNDIKLSRCNRGGEADEGAVGWNERLGESL